MCLDSSMVSYCCSDILNLSELFCVFMFHLHFSLCMSYTVLTFVLCSPLMSLNVGIFCNSIKMSLILNMTSLIGTICAGVAQSV